MATEFVGTSISSGGDGQDQRPDAAALLAENPHVKFTNGQRGYVRCRVDSREWQTDYRVVPYVSRPGAGVTTRASFTVRAGERGPGRRGVAGGLTRRSHLLRGSFTPFQRARASVQGCAS